MKGLNPADFSFTDGLAEGVDRDRFRRISEALGPRRPRWQVTRKRRSPPKPWHERLADQFIDVLDRSVLLMVCAGGGVLLLLASWWLG